MPMPRHLQYRLSLVGIKLIKLTRKCLKKRQMISLCLVILSSKLNSFWLFFLLNLPFFMQKWGTSCSLSKIHEFQGFLSTNISKGAYSLSQPLQEKCKVGLTLPIHFLKSQIQLTYTGCCLLIPKDSQYFQFLDIFHMQKLVSVQLKFWPLPNKSQKIKH